MLILSFFAGALFLAHTSASLCNGSHVFTGRKRKSTLLRNYGHYQTEKIWFIHSSATVSVETAIPRAMLASMICPRVMAPTA